VLVLCGTPTEETLSKITSQEVNLFFLIKSIYIKPILLNLYTLSLYILNFILRLTMYS